jgi:deoxyribodipyrimidine photo-lyase
LKINLLIFQNDLRLHDNRAFYEACKKSQKLLVIYILEDKLFEDTKWNFPRASSSRLYFLYQSLEDLELSFVDRDSYLNIIKGSWREILTNLKLKYDFEKVFLNDEISAEEKQNINLVKELFVNAEVEIYRDNSLIQFKNLEIEADQFPSSFTKFSNLAQKSMSRKRDFPYIKEYSIPTTIQLDNRIKISSLLSNLNYEPDPRTSFPFNGGESSGVARLHYYLEESQAIDNYKETRNGLLGSDYSSKLSPWFANGSLSMRYAYQAVENYEQEYTKNKSTYWLKFEFLWREFFRHLYRRFEEDFFLKKGMNQIDFDFDNEKLNDWILANTGSDFIDANMKELNLTGFMSNRGRQNVSSYLIHDLKVDWRAGASYFESKLIDYDVYSNWGNWQYIAGLGATNQPHVFDIDFQRKRYDADSKYVFHWLS